MSIIYKYFFQGAFGYPYNERNVASFRFTQMLRSTALFIELLPLPSMTPEIASLFDRVVSLSNTPICPPLCMYNSTLTPFFNFWFLQESPDLIWELVANTYDATTFLVNASRIALANGVNLSNGTAFMAAISNNFYQSLFSST